MIPSVFDLNAYLGQDTSKDLTKGEAMLQAANTFVRAYTRGRGFDQYGDPNDELAAVVLSVAGRMMTNPMGQYAAQAAGSFNVTYARWDGFNLLEQAVLNRYRRRAL